MPDPIIVVPYDGEWPSRFQELATRLRAALGDTALRIDHIGSTAVVGLSAKPVIDVQISVASLEPMDPYRAPLESLGFRWRPKGDLTKRYFREPPAVRRTHVHVRRAGSWSEQFSLLFRDYLRAHADEAARYAELKMRLAERYRHDREGYVYAKGPFIWEMMRRASEWSQAAGWEPGPSDC